MTVISVGASPALTLGKTKMARMVNTPSPPTFTSTLITHAETRMTQRLWSALPDRDGWRITGRAGREFASADALRAMANRSHSYGRVPRAPGSNGPDQPAAHAPGGVGPRSGLTGRLAVRGAALLERRPAQVAGAGPDHAGAHVPVAGPGPPGQAHHHPDRQP